MKTSKRASSSSKTPRVAVELSVQELNYITMAFVRDIRSYALRPLGQHEGRMLSGNEPTILAFTVKTHKRLSKIRDRFSRSLLTPEQKRHIANYIREVGKRG